MFLVLLSFAIAFVITFFATPVIITVAERKRLYDVPDERKIHETPKPSLGGLGIFAGFTIAVLITSPFHLNNEIQYFLAAALVIFFLGLKDDILIIAPIKKFIGQLIATFLVIYAGDIQISSMQGFLGIYNLPEGVSLLLTYFTVMVVVNSFNLIDGVDGLAGSLGMVAFAFFGYYFFSIGLSAYAILSFAMAGSVLAFLIFNYQPAKIFMGDTGSMLIGLVCAILVVKFISISQNPASGFALASSPAIGFTALMVPLLDTLRVFAIRILNKRSPFSPDRNHIHHLMLDRGFSHRVIALVLALVNGAMILFVFNLRNLGSTVLIGAVVAFFFSSIAILFYSTRKAVKPPVVPQLQEMGTTSTIVTRAKTKMVGQEN